MSDVITRFPPSPTGYFHIGSARTALFNYLFAAHHGGKLSFRFEDTDRERSKKEYEEDIVAGLRWLGISYIESEPLRQTERTEVYREYLKKLLASGAAYEAEESTDDPTKRVVRFKNPNVRVTFTDLIRGEVSFDTAELKDFVIARSVEEPLYHLAVIIDDHENGITHVIRGEDHISNTARQILMQEALDFDRPVYAHIPLILAPDRSKLSKRHGAVSVNEYRKEGYLPQALVNYLALLGWHPEDEREIFSLGELAKVFDISRVQKGGAIFDIEKLVWFNREYIRRMSKEDFAAYAAPALKEAVDLRGLAWDESIAERLLPLLQHTIDTSAQLTKTVGEGEYDFFFADPVLEAAKIPDKRSNENEAREHLAYARTVLWQLENFTEEGIHEAIWAYATEKGRAAVLWPLRYALTGREKSPNPFAVASIIGKNAALRRVEEAMAALTKRS